jgi:CBS domain-containing protein
MQAKDIMTTAVECISPDALIPDAAQMMKTLDVGFLPVCERDRLIGTLTDRDVVVRVIAEGKNIKDCRVRDVMTAEVHWVYEDQSEDEIAEQMSDKEVRRVLVLSRDKRLTGVISLGDLAKEQEKTAGETMKDIVESLPEQAA